MNRIVVTHGNDHRLLWLHYTRSRCQSTRRLPEIVYQRSIWCVSLKWNNGPQSSCKRILHITVQHSLATHRSLSDIKMVIKQTQKPTLASFCHCVRLVHLQRHPFRAVTELSVESGNPKQQKWCGHNASKWNTFIWFTSTKQSVAWVKCRSTGWRSNWSAEQQLIHRSTGKGRRKSNLK